MNKYKHNFLQQGAWFLTSVVIVKDPLYIYLVVICKIKIIIISLSV